MLAFGFQPAPPGLWSLETPLTSDLLRAWQAVSSSLGKNPKSSHQLNANDLVLVRLSHSPSLRRPWSTPKKSFLSLALPQHKWKILVVFIFAV
jgi:hypothetical protein